jgi:hypothetical protein
MKLTKTNQKIDNNVCRALTIVCEESLEDISGFCWLTHRANYTNFPASLMITCVFKTAADITALKDKQLDRQMQNSIQKQLLKVGVVLKNSKLSVRFDSEEGCELEHAGDWEKRLMPTFSKQRINTPSNKGPSSRRKH